MNPSNFFALILRMKFIDRWGLMRGSFSDDLEEHCFETAIIAHCLCTIGSTVYHRQLDAGRCAVLALYHDATEILTGDMPTPVKYYNPALRAMYQEVEDAAARQLVSQLPDEMRPVYEEIFSQSGEGDEELRPYVKAADRLAALIKCIQEENSGSREFSGAKAASLKALEQSPLPETGYFIEHFLPAFSMNLQQLTLGETPD